MSTPLQDLQGFSQFAREQLSGTSSHQTLDELFDLWRLENPAETDYAENVAAINGAIDDYQKGDRGRPAGEISRELREKLELPK